MRAVVLIASFLLALAAQLQGAGAQTAAGDDGLTRSIRENTTKLSELRDQIAAQRERMTSLDGQEADYRRSVAEIEQEIEQVTGILGEMDRRERELLAQGETLSLIHI